MTSPRRLLLSSLVRQQYHFKDSCGVWKSTEKFGNFPVWKKIFWSVNMEKNIIFQTWYFDMHFNNILFNINSFLAIIVLIFDLGMSLGKVNYGKGLEKVEIYIPNCVKNPAFHTDVHSTSIVRIQSSQVSLQTILGRYNSICFVQTSSQCIFSSFLCCNEFRFLRPQGHTGSCQCHIGFGISVFQRPLFHSNALFHRWKCFILLLCSVYLRIT